MMLDSMGDKRMYAYLITGMLIDTVNHLIQLGRPAGRQENG